MSTTHLVLGLVFLGLAGSWALRNAGLVDQGALRWLVPLVLLAAGVVGVAASLAWSATRRGPTAARPDPPALDTLDR